MEDISRGIASDIEAADARSWPEWVWVYRRKDGHYGAVDAVIRDGVRYVRATSTGENRTSADIPDPAPPGVMRGMA